MSKMLPVSNHCIDASLRHLLWPLRFVLTVVHVTCTFISACASGALNRRLIVFCLSHLYSIAFVLLECGPMGEKHHLGFWQSWFHESGMARETLQVTSSMTNIPAALVCRLKISQRDRALQTLLCNLTILKFACVQNPTLSCSSLWSFWRHAQWSRLWPMQITF